jgi:tRNA(fMet)-specific endonuclease VapC
LLYFLDTNIIAYSVKHKFASLPEHLMRINPSNIKIPVVVKAEIRFGIEKNGINENNRFRYESFMKPYETVSLDDGATFEYAHLRADLESQGKVISPNDMFIAAIVLSKGGILVTHNTDEFSRVKGLLLEDWTV